MGGAAGEDARGHISLDDLRKYMEEKLKPTEKKKQTFTTFGAQLANEGEIMLARASDLLEVKVRLADLGPCLTGQRPLAEYVGAARELAATLARTPHYQVAIDARNEMDQRLGDCKGKVIAWMLERKLDHKRDAPRLLRELETIINDLNVAKLAELSTFVSGLLCSLFEAVEGSLPEKDFRTQLVVAEKRGPTDWGPRGGGLP
jgi:hypothetical protein